MSRQARLVISVAAEIIFAAKIYKKNDLLYFYIYNLTLKLYCLIREKVVTFRMVVLYVKKLSPLGWLN